MESLSCTLEGRPFHNFLTLLLKKSFYKDAQVTSEAIHALYSSSGLDEAAVSIEVARFEELFRVAARNSWHPSTMESNLSNSGLSEGSAHILVTLWSNEYDKVNESLASAATWNDHFHHLSWRVDVKTDSKNRTDINEPAALFELGTTPGHASNVVEANRGHVHKVKFEVNREQIGELLGQLEDVQKRMEDFNS